MIRRLFTHITIICAVLLLAMPCFAVDTSDYLKEMRIDDDSRVIVVVVDKSFVTQELTAKQVKKIYKRTTKQVHKALPKQYSRYDVRIMVGEIPLEEVQKASHTTSKVTDNRSKGFWGTVRYDGKPWVTNVSKPHNVNAALKGCHLSLWASHGSFYDAAKGTWRWQRPNMFCTTEDLFTQTIVVPYLIPMLENAGAIVFTPRERDWQTEEVVVNAENAMVRPVSSATQCVASGNVFQPRIPKRGRYAVYVRYTTQSNSTDEVLYSVYHRGMRTDFKVNQRIGGGTWVYLGTFDFDAGSSEYNRVVVGNNAHDKGVANTEAVRFGGGMGDIVRGGAVSGLPRCLEGARYYAEYAGAPYERYSVYDGQDDYKDDINVRSLMTNWIAGGSPYAPSCEGKGVPIDLSLAVHSDAGYNNDMKSVYGSLAVCTTDYNDGKLDAGISRSYSKELCEMLLEQTKKDLSERYGYWTWRDLCDRNYSETRLPLVPSAIFETLSHQSFPDMKLGHDPDFKFTLARSIYKTVLKFEAKAHGGKVVVSPLAPKAFAVMIDAQGNAQLTWDEQRDKEEASATPTSYNVYTSMGSFGYDNGTNVRQTKHTVHLVPDMPYRFRITAVNQGGESFPSEELTVVWHGANAKNVLIVNGFHRLSSPAVKDTETEKGFDIDEDPGLSYGMTAGWAGVQQVFSTATAGKEGPGTFGYCGNEMVGKFVAGNDFNYVAEHALAIATANKYNIVSASREAVEDGTVDMGRYDIVDLLLGNEKDDGHSLKPYKTFTKTLRRKLMNYRNDGKGALLVSGSYVVSDMMQHDEREFLQQLLGCEYAGTQRYANNSVKGLQQTITVINSLNPDHYATTQSDVLAPVASLNGKTFVAMQYSDGQTAAVACNESRFHTFVMGFPFECIASEQMRGKVMTGIMNFLE